MSPLPPDDSNVLSLGWTAWGRLAVCGVHIVAVLTSNTSMQRHNYVWEYFHHGSCTNCATPAPHWDSLIHSTTQFRHLEIVILDAIIWIVSILSRYIVFSSALLFWCPSYDIGAHYCQPQSNPKTNKQITNALSVRLMCMYDIAGRFKWHLNFELFWKVSDQERHKGL